MRTTLLIAVALAAITVAPAEAKDRKDNHREARETPYSNRAQAREREARRIAKEIDADRREQRRKERAYRAWDADEEIEECDDECEDEE